MTEKELMNDPDYQAYLERISAPSHPIKISPEELAELKRENQGDNHVK